MNKVYYIFLSVLLCSHLVVAAPKLFYTTEDGTSCSTAFTAQEGENILPEKSYQYIWYKFVMPRNGRISIFNSYNNVLIYKNDCENLQPIHFRSEAKNLLAGETYYLQIYSYATSNRTWTITVTDDQPGDYCHSALTSQTGANIEPSKAVSDFWLKYEMPVNGDISISNNYNMKVEVYAQSCDNLVKIAEGKDYTPTVAKNLAAGTTYFLKCTAWGKPNVWLLEPNASEQGKVCEQAVDAQEGENNIPPSMNYYWYKLTFLKDGKIKISYNSGSTFLVYAGPCGNLTEVGSSNSASSTSALSTSSINTLNVAADQVYELQGLAGEVYYLRFDAAESSTSWNMETIDKGESCQMPLVAATGNNSVPATELSTDYWFNFTMPFRGNLDLSNTANRQLWLYQGTACDKLTELTSGNGTLQLNDLPANTSLLIKAETANSEGYDFSLNVERIKDQQSIQWNTISDIPFTNGKVSLNASASSGLDVSYELLSGQATISANIVSFTAPGSITVAAHQEGNEAYNAAESLTQTFCILPEQPSISIENVATAPLGILLVSSSKDGNQWYRNNEKLDGATEASYKPTEAGNYSVQLTISECPSQLSEVVKIEATRPVWSNTLPQEIKEGEEINLSWSYATSAEVSYNIQINEINASGQKESRIITSQEPFLSVLDLTICHQYYFTVQAVLQDGVSLWSEASNTVTMVHHERTPITEIDLPAVLDICEDKSPVTLSAPEGYDYYEWNTGDRKQLIQIQNSGFYSYRLKKEGQCWSEYSKGVQINFRPNPVAIITQEGAFLTASTGTKYEWLLNGTLLPYTTQSIQAMHKGYYQVKVNNEFECTATSEVVTVNVTGIKDQETKFTLSPNPTRGRCRITSKDIIEHIQVIRLDGTIVFEKTIQTHTFEFDLSKYPNAMYIVQLRIKGKLIPHKIIKN